MTLAFLDGRVQTRVTGLSTAVTTILQADEPTDALRVASVEFAGDRLATASLLFGSVPLATGLEVPQRVISRETPLHLIGSQQLRASASSTSVSAIVSYVRLPGQVEAVGLPVSLLLNFNGANNSTSFVDTSPNGFSVTANGDAKISTAQSKFGGASGFFPTGSGHNLTIDKDDPLINVGTQDFTIEWFEYLDTTVSGNIGIFFYGGGGQNGETTQPVIGLRYESGEISILRVGYNTGSLTDQWVDFDMDDFAEADRLVADTWVHAALVRHSGVLKFYRNGNSNSTTFDWSGVSLPNADTITPEYTDSTIGSFNGSNPSNYYLDDLRVTRAALYTENFTPPTSELGLT